MSHLTFQSQGEERTANNMAFTITAKHINMECCAPMKHDKEQPSPVDNLVHVTSTHELLVQQQGEKRTVNNMTFSMTAKQNNMMECCAHIEYHTLQGQHPHKQKTERPEAPLGGMKNLLMTSTLCSCYLVQNLVIDRTQ